MRLPRRLDLLLLLAAIGIGIASYLTFVAFDPSIDPICTGVGDCVAVQESQYASVLGIPIALYGLGMYLALAGLLLARRREAWRDLPLLRVWTFAIALGGTLYSAYLTYLELWVIYAICVWCVASAVTVALMMVLSIPDLRPARPGAR